MAGQQRVRIRTERNVNGLNNLPEDWRLDARDGAHAEFVVSAYTTDATEKRFAELFGNEAHIGVRALSLRDVVVEYAKQREPVRREDAA